MFTRSQRPLSEIEREKLEDLLRQTKERISDAFFKLALLIPLDGLFLFAAIMAVLGLDRSGTAGIVAGTLAAVSANLVLIASGLGLIADRRERSRLQQAMAEDVAVVEQVEATEAVCVRDAGRYWSVLAVGDSRLLALPAEGIWPLESIPACLEIVTTGPDRLHLGTTGRGTASLMLPPPIHLGALVSDASKRRDLAARLQAAPLFSGNLARLEEALGRLAMEELPVRQRDGFPAWGLLQAKIEERFAIDFGPSGLVAELIRRAGTRPLTANHLFELVWQRLPPERSTTVCPVRPTFYRLRAALADECGLPRGLIRPSARLEDLVPRQGRADFRTRLEKRLGTPLPPYVQGDTPVVVGIVGLVGVVLLYCVGVPAVQAIDSWSLAHHLATDWWFLALGACFVPTFFMGGMALSFALAAQLFRNRYPLKFRAECATVGGLARFLANTIGEQETIPWTEETVWLTVRGMLARFTWRRPFEVKRDSLLIEDLRLSGFPSQP
jgi:hypothetical protein